MWGDQRELGVLLGKVLESAENTGEEIVFRTTEGTVYKLYHEQNCCESVYVEDVVGDMDFLVGSPIRMADEVSNAPDPGPLSEYAESYTWTFYKFATLKGYVDIRFYGTSNGYYSESVSFVWVSGPETEAVP